MVKVQEKNWKKNFLYSKLFFIFLIFMLFLLIKATWRMYEKDKTAKKNLKESNERLSSLVERREELEKSINRLSTDRGMEEEIRNNFSVVKEGEKVINIVDGEKENSVTEEEQKSRNWFNRLFSF